MQQTVESDDLDNSAFRVRLRDFFETEYPKDILEKMRTGQHLTREDHIRSQKALQSRGWFAIGWPKQYGGPGWNLIQRYIFDEELERAGAPGLIPMGVIYVGPIIYTFGTALQKQKWLPDILESRAIWAQGYSEPEAGSDLTSLQMSARKDGDAYVLNGTKIWTSQAHFADWIFCLVRTSAPERKQDGISFICVDMKTQGIRVVPIIGIDGSHHLNRVEFDNVRVPTENLIGEEGLGWKYAKFLLQNERLSYAHIARKKEDLKQLKQLASETQAGNGESISADPYFAVKVAEYEAALSNLKFQVEAALATEASSDSQNSMLKILVTENAQRLTEIFLELSGVFAVANPDRDQDQWWKKLPSVPIYAPIATANYFFQRAQTIYGGSTEVQKNIIARTLFGSN
jgi:alkylation response protein AidB-like acyl-CoA dehydrogenase